MKHPAEQHPMGRSESLGGFLRATGVGYQAKKRLSFRGIYLGGKVIRRFCRDRMKKSEGNR